jgi:hypothetical protein
MAGRIPAAPTTVATDAPRSPVQSGASGRRHACSSKGIGGIDPTTWNTFGDIMDVRTGQALADGEVILPAGGAGLEGVLDVGILVVVPARLDGLCRVSRPRR